MTINVRLLYLYLFSFVGLLITVIGCIRLVDLGLKTYVFTNADRYYYARPAIIDPKASESAVIDQNEIEREQTQNTIANRQREATGALAMIVVGVPLYLYHWSLIRKEKK